MDIASLRDRFEYYARINGDLKHDPDSATPAFLVCNLEQIAAALRNGISLPVMFLQVPEFEKSGLVDNAVENIECSFIILDKVAVGDFRAQFDAYNNCKKISDQIINYTVEDSDTYFEGGQIKTAEGAAGPLGDNLFGWGVNFGFDQAYNAQVDESKRRAV
jgi:hypothetical protein